MLLDDMTTVLMAEYRAAALEYWTRYLTGDYSGRMAPYQTMQALYRVACCVPNLCFKLLDLSYQVRQEVYASIHNAGNS